MKSLRFGRQFQHIEDLAFEMIENGVEIDNITYSTIITCAKRYNLFDKAVEWFARMFKTGLMPDEATYPAILDVYAKLSKVEEAMSLYERGKARGWKPDPIAFGVLGKMLEDMKSLGVQLNLVVNKKLEVVGKAGKAGLARSLFEEMVDSGIAPDEKTLTALIKIYGKARLAKDALELWEPMRSNGWPMNFILSNSVMCADIGLVEEAKKLFEEMKGSEKCRPDSWRYTAMLNIYGSGGNVEKAMALSGGSMSVAHTAYQKWMSSLLKIVQCTLELELKFSQGLATAFASPVEKLAVPFRERGKGRFFHYNSRRSTIMDETKRPFSCGHSMN
ncbi:pentatricopeptide repeat-containing At5g46580, chloroplastic [Olea europaea subsp. europaea]|uniref:Pentatricopeptide repeat-containing At5g46580, chloroplastic n=1 Tax=Olea europaea subsp. europaea TaxID=158383 RepID=A0A8S0U6Y1_OLEEU|nr:pentatricopeptide repeat-containing At5g46580, chloroplastic [Olea europaea subsp. europaea]